MSLEGLPRTLLLTLKARADEHQRPDGLFRDPTAVEWLERLNPLWDDDLEQFYRLGFQTGFAVRCRVYDDAVERFITHHNQAVVVELAAGLSTRYQRLQPAVNAWIELDLPEVMTLRRTLDPETESHRYIAASMFDPVWQSQIPEANPVDMLFIAEGTAIFFERDQVTELVHNLKGNFPGGTFLLDVAGHLLKEKRGQDFAAVDAPIRWTVDNESDLEGIGLEIVEVWPTLAQYPDRWGEAYRPSLKPEQRSSALIVECRL